MKRIKDSMRSPKARMLSGCRRRLVIGVCTTLCVCFACSGRGNPGGNENREAAAKSPEPAGNALPSGGPVASALAEAGPKPVPTARIIKSCPLPPPGAKPACTNT